MIQATHDGYLPADRARALLAPDDVARRLYQIPARNHRFAGAEQALVDAIGEALRWVTRQSAVLYPANRADK